MWGLGFWVLGLGFGVWGLGFLVEGLGFRVPGLGVWFQGLGFWVYGLGDEGSWFGVQGLRGRSWVRAATDPPTKYGRSP